MAEIEQNPLKDNFKYPPEQNVRNGEISVTIDPDAMAAFITITPPDPGGEAVTVDMVMDKLQAAGVTYGIRKETIELAVQESQFSPERGNTPKDYLVAQGDYPIDGIDATIQYHEVLTCTSGRPKVLDDGRVNLFDLNTVRNVPKGTVLAVLTPPTPGEPGSTVLGTKVQPKPGRDLWLRAGRGTIFSEDRLSVIADVDGHAAIMDGKIEVTSVFTVPKDVGVETGNIQFVGSVLVRGNVLPGFCVKAEGDVEIQGNIEGGTVEAKGNVTVQYGIKGGGRSRVVAGGVVKARFAENADIKAGSHVWVTDGILQSHVESGQAIEVMGKRGAIMGGRVMAKDSVSARFLGSAIGGPTEISVGSLPSFRKELRENRKKQAELEHNIERVGQTLQYLADYEKKRQLPRDKQEMMLKLTKIQEQLFANLKAIKEQYQELERTINDSRKSWVQAREVCYPGVKLSIGPASYAVTNPMQSCRFCLNEDGEIQVLMISNR
ncbi:MAG: FapA family protein [Chloroflexota bacterium]|jgi:uncharacterized protein (DUF342 family)